ncbi:MAG: Kelch repeat-containing protein [Povalibacter sp.]
MSLLIAACSGGGGENPVPSAPTITQFAADRPTYFVGERATISIAFANGTGRVEPGNQQVTSGQTITTPPLTMDQPYRLTVTDGTATVSRDLNLPVSYRDRIRAIAAPFARAEHAALTLPDGRVLIVGGDGNESAFPSSMYVFDPTNETFTEFGSMSSGRVAFIAASLPNGDVLISGGNIALLSAPRAEIIDAATGAVRPTANSPVRRRAYAAATSLHDGRVLITGGLGSGMEASVEIFDPVTATFSLQAGGLQVARSAHTAVNIDERRVLIYGGLSNDGVSPAAPEIYDPITSTSTLLTPPEPGVRMRHVAHTMPDGGVLIIGGEDFDGQPLTSVLRFDPAAGTFSALMNLATPRVGVGVGRLSDARVVAIGGVTGLSSADVTATSELITAPAQRRDGPNMNIARQAHTVTPLSNGRLLIVGGVGADRQALASAEIYE